MEDIRLEMMHEENQLMGNSPGDMSPSMDGNRSEDDFEEELEMPNTKSSRDEDIHSGSDFDDESLSPVEVAPVFSTLKSKKKNKKKKVMTTGHDFDEAELDEMDQDGLADLLGSVRLSSVGGSPLNRSRTGTPSRGSRLGRDLDLDSDRDEDTPISTAPASRAESPDGKAKKMSGKAKKKARSELAAQKVRNFWNNRFFSSNMFSPRLSRYIYYLLSACVNFFLPLCNHIISWQKAVLL